MDKEWKVSTSWKGKEQGAFIAYLFQYECIKDLLKCSHKIKAKNIDTHFYGIARFYCCRECERKDIKKVG